MTDQTVAEQAAELARMKARIEYRVTWTGALGQDPPMSSTLTVDGPTLEPWAANMARSVQGFRIMRLEDRIVPSWEDRARRQLAGGSAVMPFWGVALCVTVAVLLVPWTAFALWWWNRWW